MVIGVGVYVLMFLTASPLMQPSSPTPVAVITFGFTDEDET